MACGFLRDCKIPAEINVMDPIPLLVRDINEGDPIKCCGARDADIQTAAMAQRDATELEVVYLSEQEARDCDRTTNHADQKQWLAWTAQADRSGMYRNEMRSLSSAG